MAGRRSLFADPQMYARVAQEPSLKQQVFACPFCEAAGELRVVHVLEACPALVQYRIAFISACWNELHAEIQSALPSPTSSDPNHVWLSWILGVQLYTDINPVSEKLWEMKTAYRKASKRDRIFLTGRRLLLRWMGTYLCEIVSEARKRCGVCLALNG
jgi:hypothetical protein